MEYLKIIVKIIISLSVLNVWLLRANKKTSWRGANATSLKNEFKKYGLSETTMKIVGFVKITLAILIAASIFYPEIENYSALGMAIMMLGAIAMHFKIKDEFKCYVPSLLFFGLSLFLFFF